MDFVLNFRFFDPDTDVFVDHYECIGLDRHDHYKLIKPAIRRAYMIWHPDRNSHPEAQARFLQIKEAAKVLLDRPARWKYNELYDEVQFLYDSGRDIKFERFAMMEPLLLTGPSFELNEPHRRKRGAS